MVYVVERFLKFAKDILSCSLPRYRREAVQQIIWTFHKQTSEKKKTAVRGGERWCIKNEGQAGMCMI